MGRAGLAEYELAERPHSSKLIGTQVEVEAVTNYTLLVTCFQKFV